jgi:hypothetical protein
MHRSERSTIRGGNLKNSRASWKALNKSDKIVQRVFFGKPRSAGKSKSHVERTNFYIEREQAPGMSKRIGWKQKKELSERYSDDRLTQRWINNTEEEK